MAEYTAILKAYCLECGSTIKVVNPLPKVEAKDSIRVSLPWGRLEVCRTAIGSQGRDGERRAEAHSPYHSSDYRAKGRVWSAARPEANPPHPAENQPISQPLVSLLRTYHCCVGHARDRFYCSSQIRLPATIAGDPP